jgi:hypothetical protein
MRKAQIQLRVWRTNSMRKTQQLLTHTAVSAVSHYRHAWVATGNARTCGGAFRRDGGGGGDATGGALQGIASARVAVEATETTEHEELDANPAGGPLWWRFGSARGAIDSTEHEEP